MKPIYKFIIIFLILGIIAWVIYFVVSKTTVSENNAETSTINTEEIIPDLEKQTTTTTLATSSEIIPQKQQTGDVDDGNLNQTPIKTVFTKFEKVSEAPTHFYWFYKENNRIFYITENGEIEKVIDGKSEKISINPIKNVSIARPNIDGSMVLLKFTNESAKTVWGIFSSMDERIAPINFPITNAVWDFNNSNIIAALSQGGGTSIVELNPDDDYSKTSILIPKINLLDVDIVKKSTSEILFIEKFGNDYATSVWQYNLKTKLFTTVKNNLLEFSLNPTRYAYFFTSKMDGFVVANSSFERIMPTTGTTIPQKCSSISSIAFCFIPKTTIALFDWFTNSSFTNDYLYTYDLNNGNEDLIDITKLTEKTLDTTNVTATVSALYFINKYDNFIYALK